MTIHKKTNITIAVLAIIVLLFILLLANPIFSQIKGESHDIIAQKKEVLASEIKIKNLHDFNANFKNYQQNLERMDKLFIDISEPVEFIEFLEQESKNFKLAIEITSPSALEFNLNLNGSFPDFLRFLERLESGPYLIEIMNLSVRDNPELENSIIANLLIKIYAK